MIEYLKVALAKYNEFQGGGAQMALFWMSALMLYVGNTKEKNKVVQTLLRYTALFCLVFLCPISAAFIMKCCIGQSVYWRMLWLLPEVILLAYLFTKWVLQTRGAKRVFIALLCVMALYGTGTGFWTYIKPDVATGLEKLPRGVNDICDTLQAAEAQRQEGEIRVIVPDELICSIRQYDAKIKMPYGRAVLKGEKSHIIHDVLNQETFSAELLAHWATQYQCNYLVYPFSQDGLTEKALTKAGYEIVGQVENYQIYYLNVTQKDDWKLIQYPDASGQQGLFYTLYNQKTGSLIVIDGGWKENVDTVRKVIKAYGGKVDAWFITHFDNDHVDAFNEIYAHKKGIKIKKIYATPLDFEYYMETLREWDTPESYMTFSRQTGKDDRVTYLQRGETEDVCGLKLQVFNAYDDQVAQVNQTENDLPNIASLVFKLTGSKKSVLFCGDCHGEAMANLLTGEFGTQLQADYVQLGHHGNNSFPESFYQVVQPKVALFDAPEWLMTGEQYTAAQLKIFFKENKVKTLDYTSGMNILDMR